MTLPTGFYIYHCLLSAQKTHNKSDNTKYFFLSYMAHFVPPKSFH